MQLSPTVAVTRSNVAVTAVSSPRRSALEMCGGGGEQRSLLARRLNNRRAWIVRSTAETMISMAVVVSVFARLMGGRRARALLGVREAATASCKG